MSSPKISVIKGNDIITCLKFWVLLICWPLSAIDKLPRTLATVAESIVEQTGWSVSLLVGGPSPKLNGKIVTYM